MENASNNDDFKQIKRLLFGVIGVMIFLAAVVWGISNRQFVSRAETAEGTVVKLNAGGSHPEIKFVTKEGSEIEYPQGGLIFGYQIGDQVTVYYDRQNPRNCIINSFGALWGFPLLVCVMGICFICVALFSKSRAVNSL